MSKSAKMVLHKPHTALTKQRMRLAHIGKVFTEEHKANLRGRIVTQETSNKLRASKLGIRFTEEHKANLRKAKEFISVETRQRMRNSHIGKTPWNKGKSLPKQSLETRLKKRKTMLENSLAKGLITLAEFKHKVKQPLRLI